MNTNNRSRLEKQPASSIARMLVWRLGVVGSSIELYEQIADADRLPEQRIWIDCDGNEYDTTKFTDEDFGLVQDYLQKHWERVGKFLGAGEHK